MPESPMSSSDLERFMVQQEVQAELLRLDVDTPTVAAAAAAVGTKPAHIVKTLLFLVDGRALLVVGAGLARIETEALAARCEVEAGAVELASPQDVLTHTGYEVGSVPPFGHRRSLPTLIDRPVMQHAEVFAGGGAKRALLRLTSQELQRVSQGELADLSVDRAEVN